MYFIVDSIHFLVYNITIGRAMRPAGDHRHESEEETRMKNEQMIIEEARRYMGRGENIREDKPIVVKQKRIKLAETGESYNTQPLANRRALEAFCGRLNESEAFEKFSIIAVDAQCRPLGVYSIQGSLAEVSAYPRVAATFALLSNAHAIFLSHNHPGGTCSPSREDIDTTLMIKRLMNMLGIQVLDHIITTPDGGAYSLAQHGDM